MLHRLLATVLMLMPLAQVSTLVPSAEIEVDTRDAIGATQLMRALERRESIDTIRQLVENGADVNAVHGDDGISVLMIASSYHTGRAVRLLIEHGARVEQAARGGWTALMSAAHNSSDPQVVRTLVELGANVHARDEYGITSLMRAAQSSTDARVVEALIIAGADPRTLGTTKETRHWISPGPG